MKNTTIISAITTLAAVFTFVACHSTKEEKMEDAKENIEEARQDLKDAAAPDSGTTTLAASNATADEWKAYKRDVEMRIDKNNDRIQELKMKIKKPGVALDNMREKRIDELQERNAKLRAKLAEYKNDHNDWAIFKSDVDKELDQLSKDLDDMVNGK